MNISRVVLAALLCISLPMAAGVRRRSVATGPFDSHRILWIGAHPDDDTLVAPLIGPLCVEGHSTCAILVASHGENGPCALPGGCGDLAGLRQQEMRTAAATFHASLTQWTLPDVMSGFEATWPREQTVRALQEVIAVEQPTVILTFDPNHGSTCHPAHRLIGSYVIEAAAQSHTPVYVIETRATPEGLRYRFENGLRSAISIDARGSWHYLVEDLRVHASQFSNETVAAVDATPSGERFMFVAHASAISNGGYIAPCP